MKFTHTTFGAALFALVAMPAITHAQSLAALVGSFGAIVRLLLPIVTTLALVVFLWGLVKFIASAGNEEGRKQGRQFMIWAVIAMFVLGSIAGIVTFMQRSLGIEQDSLDPIYGPTIQ